MNKAGQFRPAQPARVVSLLSACFLFASLGSAVVRFDVFLGYDSIVPEASWFPVVCEVENDGPGFNALFELMPANYVQGQRRTLALELPTGTTKRFLVPVFSPGRYTAWDARLLDERGKVRAEALGLRPTKSQPRAIPSLGALSRTAPGRPLLPALKQQQQQDLQPLAARLQTSLFPDNPIALEGLDTIYLSSERALELKPAQAQALLAWLHGGRHLVVSVEQVFHLAGADWLRRLLPCELTAMATLPVNQALQDWVRSNRRVDGLEYGRFPSTRASPALVYGSLAGDPTFEHQSLQLATGTLRDGQVLIGPTQTPLAMRARRGRGQVTVLTFSPELEPFLSWKNRAYFWAKMVDLPAELMSEQSPNFYSSHSIDGVFGAMIDSKQVRKLPVGWLFLLLLSYLVVIGPLDRYWLKKLNRQMLTWITFPCYVALFSGLIYLIGYKLRAGESECNELHVVDVMPIGDQADWRGRTYLSLYSPVNAEYRLASELPFAALRGEFAGSYSGGQEATRAQVEQRGHNFTAEVSVPVWTSQLFVSDWWQRQAAPLSLTLAEKGAYWEVQIHNRLPTKLTHAKLIANGQVLDVGELASNQVIHRLLSKNGPALRTLVESHSASFVEAIGFRQRAFGDTQRGWILDLPASTMAASFVSLAEPQQGYRSFATPPGWDLGALAGRGDAILFAWAPGYSPVKPLNQFSPSRSQRDTMFRVAAPLRD